ncbi:MAG: hypothetical protein COV34_02065 [Candidatus Zambryskibacteria bacterium CG10_big_fil_rev_8_21_14_0_10_42_12]|uniref:Oligoendopeptidase F n=1 Tax=Candidatus Zambryskibacteria bacterium CG10_big_fil_rev_8_21_14_0_10_42_12 TaxID=1975115 RepID=A0A2H0QVT1_9BACT|nr:MAG: hypothetical protein COV34_02065 [Candidatus Zambryskibacteria bacterium CG10_big_fil_rev_8_21_14_0_10_42_12]
MAKTTPKKLSYKTEWDLSLFYTSAKDPQIAKDLEKAQRDIMAFAKKYKNKDFTKDTKSLLSALQDHEKLEEQNELSKIARYFGFRRELNAKDVEAEARLNELSQIGAKLSNEVVFFTLKLGKISKAEQEKYLRDPKLKKYHYSLKTLFDNANFLLTEPEEKIMTVKYLTSRGMWTSGFERLLNKQTVKHKGKEIPLPEASGKMPTLPTKERRELYRKMADVLYSVADFAESEMNAVVTDKKINDELRGYKLPYEATVRGYENDLRTVETLRKAVQKFNKTSHKFFNIKAKLLNEKKLIYGDRAARVGKVSKKVEFSDAVKIVQEEFKKTHPRFEEIFMNMLTNGQLDVYSKEGKSGGAFCAWTHGLPTFVMLNHTDDINSLSTLAHEMGHALHAEYSKGQGVLYEDCSTASAEVASTFFEALVFDSILEKATDKEKIILLHDKLQDDIQTIFRQMACFEFEVELHNTIREKGFLPKEDIARLMNKHMKAYLGPVFDLEDKDGFFFVSWPHIRNFFYVYSYAFGQIVSAAMYAKYKEDPAFIGKVIEFLSAGGSDSPENIFKSIGIDVTKLDFFETGLKQIEKQVKELEKLTNK